MPNSEEFRQHKKRQRHRKSERRQVALEKLLQTLPALSESVLTTADSESKDNDDIVNVFVPIPPLGEPIEFWKKVPPMCNPNAAVMDRALAGSDDRKFGQNHRRQKKMKQKLEAREERGDITREEQERLWKEHGRTHHHNQNASSNTMTSSAADSSSKHVGSPNTMSLLSANRGQRKSWQVENFVTLLNGKLLPGMTVVDFGSGSGNLSLALAAYFSNVRFVLVDRNDYSLQLVQKRAQVAGLANVQVQNFDFSPESLKQYQPPLQMPLPFTSPPTLKTAELCPQSPKRLFDLGIGLHCCGSFTDMVMEVCRLQKADCIVCPCCNGGITRSFPYPRSNFLQNCLTEDEYLDQLTKSADNQNNYAAKCWIEYDRAVWAKEQGLQVELWKLTPMECTPKHHVLYLKQNEKSAECVENKSKA